MIQLRTILKSADNTGAKSLRVFHVKGGWKRKWGRLGDVVVASVIEALPRGMVKKGEKVQAVIVRTRKTERRPDGSYIRFDDNAGVIIEGQEPKGSRIFGPVAREVREKGFTKVAAMAKELI
ncbi:MAG: 50S ribosomal protein L14 [Candidatus Shapirobacteria bacterium]